MELLIGSAVSLAYRWLKRLIPTDNDLVLETVVLLLCVLAGGVYSVLQDTVVWESLLGVAAGAGATYAFVLRRIEE